MEKASKNKSSFLSSLKKIATSTHKKQLGSKNILNTPSKNTKPQHSSLLSSTQKPTSSKKLPAQDTCQVDMSKSKKLKPKKLRNSSIEASNLKKTTKSLTKRNSSLIDIQSDDNWDSSKIPLTPAVVIRSFSKFLTHFEQTEILEFRYIYYIAAGINKLGSNSKEINNGFDDERNDYVLIKKDHISYRYEILDIIGRGSYGQVIKVYDHKENIYLAMKIIRNLTCIIHQAKIEIQILYKLLKSDDKNKFVIKILDHFIFRNHICLTFNLLDMNLYQLLKSKSFTSLPIPLIKNFTEQILQGMDFYHGLDILHCDLKPENIMITDDQSLLKIIDFGSGCFNNKKIFTYIQSRYYRAPEVILEIGYDFKIDVWSLGCIVAELYLGRPIFHGKDELDQFYSIMEVLGLPPAHMIEKSAKKNFLMENLKKNSLIQPKTRIPGSKPLKTIITASDNAFVDFINSIL
jgi:dual specificity tyrosine-phosphorylation-regulated kinase 2/3/4